MRLLFSILLLVAGAVGSASANSVLPQRIHDAVQDILDQEWGKGNVEWIVNSVPGILASSSDELIKIESSAKQRGTTLIYLSMGKGNEVARRVPLSIRVMPFAWVPVVREGMKRNHILESSDLSWERREVTAVRNDWPETAKDLPRNAFRARRTLRAGDILCWNDVERVPDILRGSTVTIISSQGNVEVSLPGKALEDGQKGELIRVENSQYRRILEARVSGEGVVTLQAASR